MCFFHRSLIGSSELLSLLVFNLGNWVVWFWLALPYVSSSLLQDLLIAFSTPSAFLLPPFWTWGPARLERSVCSFRGFLLSKSSSSTFSYVFLFLYKFRRNSDERWSWKTMFMWDQPSVELCHTSISGAKAVFVVDTSHGFGSGYAGHCPVGG